MLVIFTEFKYIQSNIYWIKIYIYVIIFNVFKYLLSNF